MEVLQPFQGVSNEHESVAIPASLSISQFRSHPLIFVRHAWRRAVQAGQPNLLLLSRSNLWHGNALWRVERREGPRARPQAAGREGTPRSVARAITFDTEPRHSYSWPVARKRPDKAKVKPTKTLPTVVDGFMSQAGLVASQRSRRDAEGRDGELKS